MQRFPTFIPSHICCLQGPHHLIIMHQIIRRLQSIASWPGWFKPALTVGSLLVMLLTVQGLMGQTRTITLKMEKEVNGKMTQVDTTVLITSDTDVNALMQSLGIKPHQDFEGLARPVVVTDSMKRVKTEVGTQQKKSRVANVMMVRLAGETIHLTEKDGFWVDGKEIKIPVETGGVLTINGESLQILGSGGPTARTTTILQPSLRLSVWPLSADEQQGLLEKGTADAGLNKKALKSAWQPAGFRIIPDATAGTYTLAFTIGGAPDTLFIQAFPEREGPLEASFKLTQLKFTGAFDTVWNAAEWSAGTYWLHIRHGKEALWRKIKLEE